MKKILLSTALITALFAPSFVLAVDPIIPPVDGEVITLNSVGRFVEDVIDFIILLAGIIVVGFIVVAGLKMVTAGSDTKKFADGKQMLIHAMWGALVVFGVGVIVNTIASFADSPTQITR